MKRALALTIALLAASPAWSMDGQGNSVDRFTVASSLGSAGTSATSSNSPNPSQAARDDALAYIASAGEIRGAQLESALRQQRHMHPQSALSDMQLALSIATSR